MFDLNSQEGIALACLAEALLRIPDNETANLFIRDKISSKLWLKVSAEDHFLENSVRRILASASQFLNPTQQAVERKIIKILKILALKISMPVIEAIIFKIIDRICSRFIMGKNIIIATNKMQRDLQYSFDMLGEALEPKKKQNNILKHIYQP